MCPSSNKLITTKELADYLGVTTAAIYKWVKEDAMPQPIRLGGVKSTLRWHSDEINAWLEESRRD